MPVITDTSLIQFFFYSSIQESCLFKISFRLIHRLPLEWSEWFRDKEGSADRDLYFPLPFFFWNGVIIQFGNLF